MYLKVKLTFRIFSPPYTILSNALHRIQPHLHCSSELATVAYTSTAGGAKLQAAASIDVSHVSVDVVYWSPILSDRSGVERIFVVRSTIIVCARIHQMATLIALVLLILACIQVAYCDFPAEHVTIDGYPRPKNFPDAPTVAYGKFPATSNRSANCDWYGWANQNSPADLAAECLPYVYNTYIMALLVLYNYRYLPNAYDYYYCRPPSNNSTSKPDPVCYDYAAQDIVCTIGCFDLSKTGLRLPPITKPGESAGTNGTTSDGSVARFQHVPLVLSLLASAVFSLLQGAG